jgi:hypothetical protein
LQSLGSWLQNDLDIRETILDHLRTWRKDEHPKEWTQKNIQHTLDIQYELGWDYVLEGWLAMEWEIAQQEYYMAIWSRRSGFQSLIQLICKLWLIAWELWEHMNSILHDNINIHDNACLARTSSDIQKRYIKARWLLPRGIDRYEYLVETSCTSLLQKPLSYKKAWLHATGAALGARGMTNF